jgi:hypothetical protein
VEDAIMSCNLNGYDYFHKITSNERGGGLAIYIDKNITANHILSNCLNSLNTDGHEFLLINLSSLDFKVCATYRKPASSVQDYTSKLDSLLNRNKKCFVAGDTNINIL